MSKLLIKNINKSFNHTRVLNSVSLKINQGELISLLGESGTGKSTLLKVIAGLVEPDEGDIIIDGLSVLSVPPEKRKTVIVFQNQLLFPHLNVEENIGFGLKMAGADKEHREFKTAEIMYMLKLQGLEERYPKELSGGQQQRVALGRALAVEPKVLLLDEPFSSLDTRLRQEMRDLVLNIQKKLKITTILVTHDKEEALMMSHKIAVMMDGSIAQFDTPENIYERPVSRKVSDFFGEKNYLEGTLDKGIFKCHLGDFDTGTSFIGSGTIMMKPEDIDILEKEQGACIKGIVKTRRYLGDKVHYTVETAGIILKITSSEHMKFKPGNEVIMSIDFQKGIFYQ